MPSLNLCARSKLEQGLELNFSDCAGVMCVLSNQRGRGESALLPPASTSVHTDGLAACTTAFTAWFRPPSGSAYGAPRAAACWPPPAGSAREHNARSAFSWVRRIQGSEVSCATAYAGLPPTGHWHAKRNQPEIKSLLC
eukprot:671622-Pelagomonas_calceolata.AAC.8